MCDVSATIQPTVMCLWLSAPFWHEIVCYKPSILCRKCILLFFKRNFNNFYFLNGFYFLVGKIFNSTKLTELLVRLQLSGNHPLPIGAFIKYVTLVGEGVQEGVTVCDKGEGVQEHVTSHFSTFFHTLHMKPKI